MILIAAGAVLGCILYILVARKDGLKVSGFIMAISIGLAFGLTGSWMVAMEMPKEEVVIKREMTSFKTEVEKRLLGKYGVATKEYYVFYVPNDDELVRYRISADKGTIHYTKDAAYVERRYYVPKDKSGLWHPFTKFGGDYVFYIPENNDQFQI